MVKAEQWLSGEHILKKWNMDATELFFLLEQGLPAYFRDNDEWIKLEGNLKNFLPRDVPGFLFNPSDIESFERENDWIVSKVWI